VRGDDGQEGIAVGGRFRRDIGAENRVRAGLVLDNDVPPGLLRHLCRTMRVAPSVMPPGGYGMIQRTGLLGHAEPCAWITVETSRARTASADLSGCITKPPRKQIARRRTKPDHEGHQAHSCSRLVVPIATACSLGVRTEAKLLRLR
jgi:hypothetical protein